MVADEFYDSKPGVDLSEGGILQGLKGLLALICCRQVMTRFAARYSLC